MIGKHDAEGQNEQIISFEGFHNHSVSDRNPMCLGCDRVKKKLDSRREKGWVRLSCSPRFPSRLRNYWVNILNVAFKLIQVVNRQYMCRPDSDSEILLKLR